MSDHGTPPTIPTQFQQYNSYVIDPEWQIKFTIIWTSMLAVSVVFCAQHLLKPRMRWFGTILGVRGHMGVVRYKRVGNTDEKTSSSEDLATGKNFSTYAGRKERSTTHRIAANFISSFGAAFYFTLPWINLNAGQLLLIAGYLTSIAACLATQAPLITNPNRPGFLVLAQLPPLFLLSTKNSLLSLVLPPFFSYTRLNYLHRWAGRGVFLAAVVHGALWIQNHLQWNIPILGPQKETSGVAALGVLCVLVLGSLRWVRTWSWGLFYWLHFLTFPAFFITVCYHTVYAPPWIFPAIAFYVFDILMRQFRYRIKDAYLIRVDQNMTIIRIPDVATGFRAGQHFRLRVFFDGRGVFEAHPLSIMCAPAGATCLQAGDVDRYFASSASVSLGDLEVEGDGEPPGILLGARVVGDWTKALNEYTLRAGDNLRSRSSSGECSTSRAPFPVPVPVQVMFDGPYGGCTLDLESYERVLLVAGGSGATFVIGVLDELVAGCALSRSGGRRAKTQRVDLIWSIRSFACIKWFAPLLDPIARMAAKCGVELRIDVYVTCLCVSEDVPDVVGMEVRLGGRPDVARLMCGLLGVGGAGAGEGFDEEQGGAGLGCEKMKEKEQELFGGRLGVCASGPAGLTREAANAVTRFVGTEVGGRIGLHTEVFAV